MTRASWWRHVPRRRDDYWPLVAILAFFLLFFYPVFFGGKFFVINDAFVELYPLRVAMWNELREGRLPLWTPFVMSGYPILSMAQNAVGYPLTWGYLFLPAHWAEQIYTIAPYLLSPIFIYAYAREIGRSRFGALLAGLTFSYGGLMISAVANNGLLPNAVMWLPLMLIAIERARTRPFIPCLLGAAGAYAMSVLTGVGQGFLYAGLIAAAYGLFLSLTQRRTEVRQGWQRWSPFFVACGALMLAAGIAAWQILETMRAQRRSIRGVLSYELYTEGAYTFTQFFQSLVCPLHYINHATPAVPVLVIVLAIFAVVLAVKDTRRDIKVFFWAALAVVAWVLMLGPNTPVHDILYYVPIYNSFRAPARHAFEWTFAVAILSAYGWDVAREFLTRSKQRLVGSETSKVVVALGLLVGAIVVLILWRLDFATVPPLWDESNHYPSYPWFRYVGWKIVFSFLTIATVWSLWKISSPSWRSSLSVGVIALACFAEPSIMASRWWWPALKTAERFTTPSATTTWLLNNSSRQNRIYTRAVLWTEEYQQYPRLDSGNLTAIYGLRNVGGYEPLILERYSRALGGVWMDSSNPRPGYQANTSLFEPQSHVLDLLNTEFIVSYADLQTEPTRALDREGIRFGIDLGLTLKPGETKELKGVAAEIDTLAMVTSMADSSDVSQGTPVAKVRMFTSDGRAIERDVRAGFDTAEWAHERADVKARIAHQLAPVFDSSPGDENNSFPFHRYWTRIDLGERAQVDRIELTNVSERAIFGVWKMTLYDASAKRSLTMPHYDLERFESVYEKDGVEIIRNRRLLPRVWLVAEAEAVDGEEALRRIQGNGSKIFDPKRTALLEVTPQELPSLPGGEIGPAASARLVAEEPNRLQIETRSDSPALLVLSETIYPGWIATVDGQRSPIHATNFILRSVAVPAGTHQVELRYTAPAARNGTIISLLTLFGIGLVGGGFIVRKKPFVRTVISRFANARDAVGNVLEQRKSALTKQSKAGSVLSFIGRITKTRTGSLVICIVFTAGMVYSSVFPLNTVWSVNGIIEPDCGAWIWNLWSVTESISSGQNPYSTNLLYYPIGVPSLMRQAIGAGFFPLAFIVKIVTGGDPLYPVYTFRLTIWLCLSLLLFFSFHLLRTLGFTWIASVAGGIAFAFSDFFMDGITSIAILAAFFIPLSALCLVNLYRRPDNTRSAIFTALVLAVAPYFTETTIYIYLGAPVVVLLMSLFSNERALLASKLKQLGSWRLLLASAVFLLLIGPYVVLTLRSDTLKPSLAEHFSFSANVAGFFVPHPVRTPIYSYIFNPPVHLITKGVGSQVNFISYVLLVFGVVGLLMVKNRLLRIAAAAALVFFVLSLGPTLKIFETDTQFPLPYSLLMHYPPFSWGRTPVRFVLPAMFFLMIVAAGGISWFGGFVKRRRGNLAAVVTASLLLVWVIAEAYSPTPRQPPLSVPQNLAERVSGPVLNVPVYENDGYAMFLQLFHRQPIATGYLARFSEDRIKHLGQLNYLFDKGGAGFCEGVARMGINTIIVSPEAYVDLIAPGSGPFTLGPCHLNVIDLRQNLQEQPRGFPLLPVGERLEFNSPASGSYLWYGWSYIETLSRWSNRSKAAVVFSLDEIGDRVLSIKLFPFLPKTMKAQRINLSVNGHPLESLAITSSVPNVYTVNIPGAALREKNILTFDLPDADSPARLGIGEDRRVLSINVEWIKLDLP